jgi:hypothetical protein
VARHPFQTQDRFGELLIYIAPRNPPGRRNENESGSKQMITNGGGVGVTEQPLFRFRFFLGQDLAHGQETLLVHRNNTGQLRMAILVN